MAQHERQRKEPLESRLRLQTAVRLRWFGVIGQLLTVCFVYLVLGFPLPFGICLALIALSAWLNVFLRIRYPGPHAPQRAAGDQPAGLRHSPAGRAALSDGRRREPVHVPAGRPGHRVGGDGAAARHHRARHPGRRRQRLAGDAPSSAALVRRRRPRHPAALQARHPRLRAVGHGVSRAVRLAAGQGGQADDGCAGRHRDGARPRAAAARARWPRRRGGARARHAARDHHARHQGAGAGSCRRTPRSPRTSRCCRRRPCAAGKSCAS